MRQAQALETYHLPAQVLDSLRAFFPHISAREVKELVGSGNMSVDKLRNLLFKSEVPVSAQTGWAREGLAWGQESGCPAAGPASTCTQCKPRWHRCHALEGHCAALSPTTHTSDLSFNRSLTPTMRPSRSWTRMAQASWTRTCCAGCSCRWVQGCCLGRKGESLGLSMGTRALACVYPCTAPGSILTGIQAFSVQPPN